ncbi:hypothetical protein, partial [Sessilibacter corallicola]|uniref:hypothetical protein n=1 Tax=Sessilibacter corallicola TaxID=2904075 RepID=UPI00333F1ECC
NYWKEEASCKQELTVAIKQPIAKYVLNSFTSPHLLSFAVTTTKKAIRLVELVNDAKITPTKAPFNSLELVE